MIFACKKKYTGHDRQAKKMTGRQARPRKTYARPGRLKGSTAYLGQARPTKSKPIWTSDDYIID